MEQNSNQPAFTRPSSLALCLSCAGHRIRPESTSYAVCRSLRRRSAGDGAGALSFPKTFSTTKPLNITSAAFFLDHGVRRSGVTWAARKKDPESPAFNPFVVAFVASNSPGHLLPRISPRIFLAGGAVLCPACPPQPDGLGQGFPIDFVEFLSAKTASPQRYPRTWPGDLVLSAGLATSGFIGVVTFR